MFEQYTRGNIDFTKQFREEFMRKDMLSRIISINVGVFIILLTNTALLFLLGVKNPLVEFLSVPAQFELLKERPWGIVTYMFIHKGFFHLLFNMILLYWVGKYFIHYFSQKLLLTTYIAGGIGGGILYMLAFSYLPSFAHTNPNSYAIGASASVMAVFFAVTFYDPSRTLYLLFLGRIKMMHLALGFIVLDILMLPNGNAGGHISHIGGALVGMALGVWKKRQSSTIFSRANGQPKYSYDKDYSYNTQKKVEEDEINSILDKISKSGYESLSTEERKKLFKSSYKK